MCGGIGTSPRAAVQVARMLHLGIVVEVFEVELAAEARPGAPPLQPALTRRLKAAIRWLEEKQLVPPGSAARVSLSSSRRGGNSVAAQMGIAQAVRGGCRWPFDLQCPCGV